MKHDLLNILPFNHVKSINNLLLNDHTMFSTQCIVDVKNCSKYLTSKMEAEENETNKLTVQKKHLKPLTSKAPNTFFPFFHGSMNNKRKILKALLSFD